MTRATLAYIYEGAVLALMVVAAFALYLSLHAGNAIAG